ncbi:hypothetical protein [Noviherbaspirillum massiliense]|uniref:hypothetical protein n=1 Tax=Noviherbaspirillum massiliense TaxID=1465823 RepID=UPI00030C8BBC|nr:hypothetical protein [Noviherbaspirillum massiliense]
MMPRPDKFMRLRAAGKAGKRGFSLVSAMFLLVVLSTLGAAILNISTAQHMSSALDVQGARAYQAARAGIEWGMYKQLQENKCNNTTSFQLPAGSTLGAFTVTVECSSKDGPVSGAGTNLKRWLITSTACNQPTATGICPNPGQNGAYVERRLQVQF